jgi:hypothetical protein
LAALGLVLATGACYPGDGPANVQDLDVTLTIYDESVNFAGFQTFAMPDTVVEVSNDTLDALIPISRANDELILDLVADNMASVGYTRELDPVDNGADLILLVSAIGVEKTDYWVYQDWWYYWGYYPGWGYPGYPSYGPGYGWYYPPTYVGSVTYEQGTLLLTLIDPNAADGTAVPVIWSGAIRGLMNQGSSSTRITNGINQAFSQSPYLGR